MSASMEPAQIRAELLQLAADATDAVNAFWEGEFDLRSVGAVLDQLAKANSRALREIAARFPEPEQVEGVAGPAVQDFLPEPERDAITEERIEQIVAGLNGFIVPEFEDVSEIVFGVAVHSREIVGSDFNLDKAIAWAQAQPDVSVTCGPDSNGAASVELSDCTVIEWDADAKEWAPVFADEPSEVAL